MVHKIPTKSFAMQKIFAKKMKREVKGRVFIFENKYDVFSLFEHHIDRPTTTTVLSDNNYHSAISGSDNVFNDGNRAFNGHANHPNMNPGYFGPSGQNRTGQPRDGQYHGQNTQSGQRTNSSGNGFAPHTVPPPPTSRPPLPSTATVQDVPPPPPRRSTSK